MKTMIKSVRKTKVYTDNCVYEGQHNFNNDIFNDNIDACSDDSIGDCRPNNCNNKKGNNTVEWRTPSHTNNHEHTKVHTYKHVTSFHKRGLFIFRCDIANYKPALRGAESMSEETIFLKTCNVLAVTAVRLQAADWNDCCLSALMSLAAARLFGTVARGGALVDRQAGTIS